MTNNFRYAEPNEKLQQPEESWIEFVKRWQTEILVGGIGFGEATHDIWVTYVEQDGDKVIRSVTAACGSKRFGSWVQPELKDPGTTAVTCQRCRPVPKKK